jgi:hypothetical protein
MKIVHGVIPVMMIPRAQLALMHGDGGADCSSLEVAGATSLREEIGVAGCMPRRDKPIRNNALPQSVVL